MEITIKSLLEEGKLGYYNSVEVIEVFACLPDKSIINVYTIMVAEESCEQVDEKYKLLNPDRITIKELKNWSFGIKRTVLSLFEFDKTVSLLSTEGIFSINGDSLGNKEYIYKPAIFVPPDSYDLVPFNKILKNNFHNGSYVLEWSMGNVGELKELLDSPPSLQSLSDEINEYLPIGIAGLSDKIGSYIFQVPINVIQARFYGIRESNDFNVKVAWHPKAIRRNIRFHFEMEHDKVINGFASSLIQDDETRISVEYDYGPYRGIIWDDENQIILAATRPSSIISSMSYGIGFESPEPRMFDEVIGGHSNSVRVAIQNTMYSIVGNESSISNSLTQKRLYKNEKSELTRQKKFVQYTPSGNNQNQEHLRALQDIRDLINTYGEKSVWLWDPYLTAHDVIKTLFYCKFHGANLRAITNLEDIPRDKSLEGRSKGKKDLRAEQSNILNQLNSNFLGINLEFRARIGQLGWEFHDRFIIFPDAHEGPLAWSLGTSINSLGKKHHILQQVDDGQLVADSFLSLWNELDQQENLIWKR